MLIAESPANNDDSAGKNYHDDDSVKDHANNDDSGEDHDDDESPADQPPTHLWAQLLVEPFSTAAQ